MVEQPRLVSVAVPVRNYMPHRASLGAGGTAFKGGGKLEVGGSERAGQVIDASKERAVEQPGTGWCFVPVHNYGHTSRPFSGPIQSGAIELSK